MIKALVCQKNSDLPASPKKSLKLSEMDSVRSNEWKIVYVNLRACEMWGLATDRLIGRVFWKVFPQMIGTDAEERLRGAIKAGSRVEYEAIRRSSRAGCGCASARCQTA